MRTRWLAAAIAAIAVTPMAATSAEALTKDVSAGPLERTTRGLPRDADLNRFFRKVTTVHVGDRVRFGIHGFHNILFPGPGDAPAFVIPDPANPVTGANDAAGQPFWFNGQPRLIINPVVAFPSGGKTVDGTKLVNSGIPAEDGPPKPFVVKFSKTGTFDFLCSIHDGMKGKIKVLARGRRIPSARADRAAARAEQAAAVAQARRRGDDGRPAARTVGLGNDSTNFAFFRMFPKTTKVKVGDVVTFTMPRRSGEVHNAAFGPAAYRKSLARNFFKPVPNQGGPPSLVLDALTAYPSQPAGTELVQDGSVHGNGYVNTGLLDSSSASPLPRSAKIRFTKAGKYAFECIVHSPGMSGTIEVTS